MTVKILKELIGRRSSPHQIQEQRKCWSLMNAPKLLNDRQLQLTYSHLSTTDHIPVYRKTVLVKAEDLLLDVFANQSLVLYFLRGHMNYTKNAFLVTAQPRTKFGDLGKPY